MAPAATPTKRSSTKKAAAKPKTKSTKAKSSTGSSSSAASKSAHGGRYVAYVVEAIQALKVRGGASRQKIGAYIEENHPDADIKQVKLALKRGTASGALSQHGQSFRVGGKSSTSTAPKPKTSKPKTIAPPRMTVTKTKSPAVKKSAPKTKKSSSKKSTKSPKKKSAKSPKKKSSTKKAAKA